MRRACWRWRWRCCSSSLLCRAPAPPVVSVCSDSDPSLTMGSRGRSSYYGNCGGVGFFGSSSERLLHPAAARHDVSASATAADHLADLDEEDVWSAVTTNDINYHHRNGGALMHHRQAYAGGGGLSLVFEAASSSPPARHSAPVSVPEWPAATDPEDRLHHHRDRGSGSGSDLEWVPPHEYLQRRWCGAGGAAAAAVLEGAGRTLKGRDITRVRDAVWSKTGFFG